MENIRPVSLDILLGATSKTGSSRSAGRSQAGGLSDADGQQKEFVLPEDDAPACDVAPPKTPPARSSTNRPDGRARFGDRPRSRDPLGAAQDDQAVNPQAAASRPQPANEPLATADTVNPSDAMKVAGVAQPQVGPAANGATGIAAWWQSMQGANQTATGQVPAPGGAAAAAAPAWLQAQANAQAAAGEAPQPTAQAQAATAPQATAAGGQVAANLGPHGPQMPTPADTREAVGTREAADTREAAGTRAATGATALAPTMPAANSKTLSEAATQIAPSGTEAKPVGPSVAPVPTAGETEQRAQTTQTGQAPGRTAPTHSLADMVQRGITSAAGEKAPAEVDPNLQAQAKLMDRAEQASRFRSASLPEPSGADERHAAGPASILAGSHRIDGAAQGAPQPADGPGEHRIAEVSHPADQIIRNVRQAIANGQREVTINLNPPELGRVRLTMHSEGNEIRGRLDVDNPRTLTEIRHQADLLTQRLAEEGIAIRRLEVHPMSNANGQAGSYSPQHQESAAQTPFSHHRPAQAEHARDRAGADSGSPAALVAASAGESASAGGLNVWI